MSNKKGRKFKMSAGDETVPPSIHRHQTEKHSRTINHHDILMELGAAYETIKDKEDELRLAGEIGQMLIEKNDNLENQMNKYKEEIASLQNELQASDKEYQRIKEGKRNIEKDYLKGNEKLAHCNSEIEQLISENSKLINEIQHAKDVKFSEMVTEKALLERSIISENNIDLLKKELKEKDKEISHWTDELNLEHQRINKLTDNYEEKIKNYEDKINKFITECKCSARLSQINSLKWEIAQLAGSVDKLTLSNQELRARDEEQRRLLEAQNYQPLQPIPLVQYPSVSSMLDNDDEKDEQEKKDDNVPRRKSKQQRNAADQEFFFLTVLSVRLNSGALMEQLVELESAENLYIRAQEQHVPFETYQQWVEKELTLAYLNKKYLKKPTGNQIDLGAQPRQIGNLRLRRRYALKKTDKTNDDDVSSKISRSRNAIKYLETE